MQKVWTCLSLLVQSHVRLQSGALEWESSKQGTPLCFVSKCQEVHSPLFVYLVYWTLVTVCAGSQQYVKHIYFTALVAWLQSTRFDLSGVALQIHCKACMLMLQRVVVLRQEVFVTRRKMCTCHLLVWYHWPLISSCYFFFYIFLN